MLTPETAAQLPLGRHTEASGVGPCAHRDPELHRDPEAHSLPRPRPSTPRGPGRQPGHRQMSSCLKDTCTSRNFHLTNQPPRTKPQSAPSAACTSSPQSHPRTPAPSVLTGTLTGGRGPLDHPPGPVCPAQNPPPFPDGTCRAGRGTRVIGDRQSVLFRTLLAKAGK